MSFSTHKNVFWLKNSQVPESVIETDLIAGVCLNVAMEKGSMKTNTNTRVFYGITQTCKEFLERYFGISLDGL